ncbi:hypothetical protein [Mammaliicoccus sciuri]|uniref:hypothetical protein n=1 Tax=Mammaliicoccus sciuri TaxID=1296 RepID=UPI0034DDB73F
MMFESSTSSWATSSSLILLPYRLVFTSLSVSASLSNDDASVFSVFTVSTS